MKKSLALLASLALLTANAFAQGSNSSRADGFRGLILNQTTSEDAARILGQPAADKVDRLDVTKISKWLDPKQRRRSSDSFPSRTSATFHLFNYHSSKIS